MKHALLPNGMVRTDEDSGPRRRLRIPTAPIGVLWPEWWGRRTPVPAPVPPPPRPFCAEDEAEAMDATTRPRDRELGNQQYRGKRITLADVPPYQLEPASPWARRPWAVL